MSPFIDLRDCPEVGLVPDRQARILNYDNPCRIRDKNALSKALEELKDADLILEERISQGSRYHIASGPAEELLSRMLKNQKIILTESRQQQEKTNVLLPQAEQAVLRRLYHCKARSWNERRIANRIASHRGHVSEGSLAEGYIVSEMSKDRIDRNILQPDLPENAGSMSNPFKGWPSLIKHAIAALEQKGYIANPLRMELGSKTKSYTITDPGIIALGIEKPIFQSKLRENRESAISSCDNGGKGGR